MTEVEKLGSISTKINNLTYSTFSTWGGAHTKNFVHNHECKMFLWNKLCTVQINSNCKLYEKNKWILYDNAHGVENAKKPISKSPILLYIPIWSNTTTYYQHILWKIDIDGKQYFKGFEDIEVPFNIKFQVTYPYID